MTVPRRMQLTLFFTHEVVEEIRNEYNPAQSQLIGAHVTLCRDEEIEDIVNVLANLKSLQSFGPINITFGPPERSEGGKGVLLPATNVNPGFYALRKAVLKGTGKPYKFYQPHVTLMHPRNSTCTDTIFSHIQNCYLPSRITFETVSLIEQNKDGKWVVIEEFSIV